MVIEAHAHFLTAAKCSTLRLMIGERLDQENSPADLLQVLHSGYPGEEGFPGFPESYKKEKT